MALSESTPHGSPAQGLDRAISQSEAKDSLPYSSEQIIESDANDANLERELRVVREAMAGGEGAQSSSSGFDTLFWEGASEIVFKKLKLNQLRQRYYIRFLQVTIEGFGETGEGLDLFNERCALEVEGMLVREQIRICHAESATLKSLVEVFVSSPSGFNIRQVCRGKRDGYRQQNFANDLILKQDSKHPTPALEYYWCPILEDWLTKAAMIAGHLVPWRCGAHGMRAIFGDDDDDTTDAKGNNTEELFKAENGIYWSREAEQRFSAGLFVIVPDVPEKPPASQILGNWERSSGKRDYKIMVLDPYHKLMTQRLSPRSSETWADKHGQRVQFRTDFRPRARYLYFTYCEALLKRSFVNNTLHYEIAREESRKRCWGVMTGKYILKSALRGFVEVMGRDYGHILQGGIEDDGPVGFAGVALAGKNIQDGVERRDAFKDVEEDEDSDDGKDDDDNSDNDDDVRAEEEEDEKEEEYSN